MNYGAISIKTRVVTVISAAGIEKRKRLEMQALLKQRRRRKLIER
jgi:hypothetical protein